MGAYAGQNNTTGNVNTFLGAYSGKSNTTGNNNSFIGYGSGFSNTTGDHNTSLGYNAGQNNTTGRLNTFIGSDADLFSTTQYTNATAIGFNAKVDANDAIVLGNGNVSVGIGIITPSSPLHVVNSAGSQIKFGNVNQPNLEWYWDVDGTSHLYLRNEGNGTAKTGLYMDVNTGYLGLGPNSPGYKLTVVGGASDEKASIYAINNATNNTTASHGIQGVTNNTYSLSAGIFGNNNGVGPSIYGVKNASQSGIAGRFEIQNTTNSADGLFHLLKDQVPLFMQFPLQQITVLLWHYYLKMGILQQLVIFLQFPWPLYH